MFLTSDWFALAFIVRDDLWNYIQMQDWIARGLVA